MATAKSKRAARQIVLSLVESMSFIPMGGYKTNTRLRCCRKGNEDYYWEWDITAEAVANNSIFREDQDEFVSPLHQKY
jgi:acetyl-CoA acyltransferase